MWGYLALAVCLGAFWFGWVLGRGRFGRHR
jgi:hypothetical protein